MSERRSTPAPPKTREEALRDFRTGQILAAARRVIGKLGYAESSIDRIAEAAGVARSTVYVYFDGKEDLLNQCLAENRVELSDRVREAVERADGLEGRLQAFLTSILAYVGEYHEFFRAIMRVRGLDPFFHEAERPAPELDVIRVEIQAVIADIFKQGQLDGILTPESSLEAARVIGSLIYGSLMWRANEPEPIPAEEEARILVQTLLYGLTRPRAG